MHCFYSTESIHSNKTSFENKKQNNEKQNIHLQVHDWRRLEFVSQLCHFSRILWSIKQEPTHEPYLALPGTLFPLTDGLLMINNIPLYIDTMESKLGAKTGCSIWDGSIVLAKFLEQHASQYVHNATILELGSGTGVVGLAAARLGALHVELTDLEYALPNLQHNIAINGLTSNVSASFLDWTEPPNPPPTVTLLLASDVVWIEELIEPLVGTFASVLRANFPNCRLLMSYQRRSAAAEELLLQKLTQYHLFHTVLPSDSHHPAFQHPKLSIWELKQSLTP